MVGRHSLAGIRVLVVGIEELISRDIVRVLVAEEALATAAASDEAALIRLQRDLGLYRTTVDIAPIDLFSGSEMRLFATNLRGQGKLPHVIVCCCSDRDCPMAIAASVLEPSLVIHALPMASTWLGRALCALNAPDLPALFARLQRLGLFKSAARPWRVLIAGQPFSLRRWDGVPRRAKRHSDRANGPGARRPSRLPAEAPSSPRRAPKGPFQQDAS